MKRKWLLALMAIAVALVLAACGGGGGDGDGDSADGGGKDVLEVWSFTDEAEKMITEYYLKDNPDLPYEIKIVQTPTDQFEQKLDPILGSDNAPDVVFLEQMFVKKYVESGMLEDLSQFDAIMSNIDATVDYVVQVGTNSNGEFVANAWQATPGAFFYRDSMAKEYLGLETPEEVQAAISDWNKFYETAVKLKEATNGEVYMISTINDLFFPYYGTRSTGWVEDGKLMIDESLYELMDLAKTFVQEGLTLDAPGESEAYFAGMSSDYIFGYTLPTWGLHYWLKPNAENADTGETTAGDWRMVMGPAPYFRGGTWIGITKTSDMKEEAADLIAYLTVNEDFLTKWAQDTGDFVANMNVVNAIKDNYSEEFLGGQNHYAAFAEQVPNIQAKVITEYDQTFNGLFIDHALTPYSKGEVDKDTAIEDFKAAVQNAYPDISVD